jgi:tetratricopeptide (TPR) repeat protein/CHAT domain-containing protein
VRLRPTAVVAAICCTTLIACHLAPAQEWAELIHHADSLSKEDHIDVAIDLAQNALKIVQREFGKSDTSVASALDVLGTCYRFQADFDKAESNYRRALEIRIQALGLDHVDVANSLHNIGILRYSQGRYAEADSIHHRALQIREQHFGHLHPEVARSLNALGVLYWAQGQYDQAEDHYKQALEIWKETLGPKHRRVADCLNNLGNLYWQQGRYTDAEQQYRSSLEILEATLGENHPDVAKGLNNLAILYRQQGRYADAEPLYNRALDIWTRSLGPEHPNVADCMNNLGVLYYQEGKYREAEPLLKDALAIQEKVLGQVHPGVADVLINLGVLYYDQGRYSDAEPLYRRALTIFTNSYGGNHRRVADCLLNLGVLYGEQGQYNKVEPLYMRALEIEKSIVGPDHPDVAGCLINLGYVYCDQGRYDDAEPMFRQALGILENALGSDHPDVAECLNCLGHVYYEIGQYSKAEPLYRRALDIQEKAFGANYSGIAYGLNSMGRLYCKQGRLAEAEPVYRRAVDIQTYTFGPDHPHVAIFLYNLADLYRMERRYAEAERLMNRALKIIEQTMGAEHPETANCLVSMTRLYRDMGNNQLALQYGKRAYDIRQKNFQDGFQVLSEKNALLYSRFMKNAASLYLSIPRATAAPNPRCDREFTDVVFSVKGAVTDGILMRSRTYSSESDSVVRALVDSLRIARFCLAKLYVQGPSEENYEAYGRELAKASAEKQRLESKLARESAAFNSELEIRNINTQKIIESLPEGTMLLEYLKYDFNTSGDDVEPQYLAVVLSSGGEVVVRRLGPAAVIDSCVAGYQAHFQNPQSLDLSQYRLISKSIYDLVVAPFADELHHATTAFIAPDGDLNMISFGGLIDSDGFFLIEKVPIHYLSSGRELIRLKRTAARGTGLLAVGDPDYDAPVSLRLALAAKNSPEFSVSMILNTVVNLFDGCAKGSEKVSALPGARRELELIVNEWQQANDEPVTKFLSGEASEENLKRVCSGKRVLHIATHAYYAASVEKQILEPYISEVSVVPNPLLRSGLYLAGANLQGAGAERPGAEDGILTAEEVAGLKLDGTQLVVLSACQTGMGEVVSGEGVYGLRCAFQKAGARTVISALWRVSDSATADLMGQLYRAQVNNLAVLMQQIAVRQIRQRREQGKSDHPFYWGGFVAIGDWKMN